MTSGSLPPWVPGPDALVAARRDARRSPWIIAVTSVFVALAWIVALASLGLRQTAVAGIIFPAAAIVGCAAILPAFTALRWRIEARSIQAIYLALVSLTPWLMFGWYISATLDVDGGAGGTLSSGVMLPSSLILLGVLPTTLVLLRQLSMRAVGWPIVRGAALAVTVLALVSASFSAQHPTADGLVGYRGVVAEFRDADDARSAVFIAGAAVVRRTERGGLCTTRIEDRDGSASPSLQHPCDATVRVYSHPRLNVPGVRGVFSRPTYIGQLFVEVEGRTISRSTAARYLLFTSPHWEWIVGALAGVALGLWTMRRTRGALSRWRGRPTCEAHVSLGVARTRDGRTVRLSAENAGLTGAVVLIDPPALGAPFRDGRPEDLHIVPGTREDWERTLSSCESLAQSFVLAVIWLPAAPLLAAPLLGMLSPL